MVTINCLVCYSHVGVHNKGEDFFEDKLVVSFSSEGMSLFVRSSSINLDLCINVWGH